MQSEQSYEMELSLADKKYHIPENWVYRWQFLTSYLEELEHSSVNTEGAHSRTITWPYTTSEAEKEIEMWIALNRRQDEKEVVTICDLWLRRTTLPYTGSQQELLKASLFYKTLLYMDLTEDSSSMLTMVDIDTATPVEVREVLYRQLGRWVRLSTAVDSKKRYDMFEAIGLKDPLNLVEYKRLPVILQEDVRLILLEFPYDVLRGILALVGNEYKSIDMLWNRINWDDIVTFCLNDAAIATYRSACEQLISHMNTLESSYRSVLTPVIESDGRGGMGLMTIDQLALIIGQFSSEDDSYSELMTVLGMHSPFANNHIAFMTNRPCPTTSSFSTHTVIETAAISGSNAHLIIDGIVHQSRICPEKDAMLRLYEYFMPYDATIRLDRITLPAVCRISTIASNSIKRWLRQNGMSMYEVIRVIARTIGLEYLRAMHHLMEIIIRQNPASYWKTCYDLIDGVLVNPEPDMTETFLRWP